MNLNFTSSVLILLLLGISISIRETPSDNSDKEKPALRTMRDIEQDFILNELKQNSRDYFDEVNFTLF